jgi:hypothetical protein
MNYSLHYERLIQRARDRAKPGEYTERHHALPRCLGGSNDRHNLVHLTAEEHYVAHQLLVKMYPGNGKLVFAVNAMLRSSRRHKDRAANKSYGWIRRAFAIQSSLQNSGDNHPMKRPEVAAKLKGANNPMYGVKGKAHPNFGKPVKLDQRGAKNHMFGRAGEMHHMFGKRNDAMQRPEVIEKMRATSLNKTAEEKAAIREKKRATFRNRTTEQREQFHSRYAATRTKNKAASC